MFAPLPTPREMAAWDRAAVELGMPEMLLMENAARAAASVLAATFGPVADRRVLVFMGAGNNGGDAACLARYAFDAGAEVLVLHTRPLGSYKGVTGQHLRLARRCGVEFMPVAAWPARFARADSAYASWMRPDVIVDGLLGTGFSGPLRELEVGLVEQINRLGRHAFVLALDIPSGLNGVTGRPSPVAVRASVTATFAAAKPGLAMPEAAVHVGALHVCDIGMPRKVRESLPPSCRVMREELLGHLPVPGASWHKGRAGHVAVVGGSPGLCGAPHLAALGALRGGAGLVTLAAPGHLLAAMKANVPDIMTHDLGESWSEHSGAALAPLLERVSALVCGPGLGRSPEAAAALGAILALPDRPAAVIDADALYALAHEAWLRDLVSEGDILTPHPGEAAELLGVDSGAVQADRWAAIRGLMGLAPGVWVLKGAGTLVCKQGQAIDLCDMAAPNLAVGGSGDVLAGSIGALLAQRVSPGLAARLGVLRHAQAGRDLARSFPSRGNTASDIALALVRVGIPPRGEPHSNSG